MKRKINNTCIALCIIWTFFNSELTNFFIIISAKNQRSIKPLSVLIQELRIIKSDYEIEVMKKSGQISAQSFIEVNYMSKKKGKKEIKNSNNINI